MRFYYLLTFIIIICGCTPYKITTHNLNKTDKTPKEKGVFYNLPKTQVHITINLTKTTYKKGPFAKYANKYLGIEDALTENKEEWKIDNIIIKSKDIIDPQHFYFLSVKKDKKEILKNILSKACCDIITSNNYPDNDTIFQNTINSSFKNYNQQFFSITGNLQKKVDTLYKTLYRDSTFVKVPVYHKQLVEKSTETKAKETAQLIIDFRKARFELLAGIDDYMPDEKTLSNRLNELKRAENRYLSLFTGITDKEKHQFKYEITPNDSMINKRVKVFKFNKQNGIIPDNKKGENIYLSFSPLTNTSSLDTLYNKHLSEKIIKNNLILRIPDKTNLCIYLGKEKMADEDIVIKQYGSIIRTKPESCCY